MTEEQIKEWLLAEEAVKCAFGDHSNHTHPVVEETTDDLPTTQENSELTPQV